MLYPFGLQQLCSWNKKDENRYLVRAIAAVDTSTIGPRPRAAVRDVLGELEELAQVRRSDSDSARKLVVAEQRLRLFI